MNRVGKIQLSELGKTRLSLTNMRGRSRSRFARALREGTVSEFKKKVVSEIVREIGKELASEGPKLAVGVAVVPFLRLLLLCEAFGQFWDQRSLVDDVGFDHTAKRLTA